MANKLRDLANRFVSPGQTEMQEATARLADLDRQIQEQADLISELSLAAVKSGMSETEVSAYLGSKGKLSDLQGLREACLRWISELEQAERVRQNEAVIKQNKSKLAAITQHIRAFDKLEAMQEKNIAAVIENNAERHAQAEKIRKLLPVGAYNEPAFKRFSNLGIEVQEMRELCRQGLKGQGQSDYRGVPSYPGVNSFRGVALGSFGLEDHVWEMDSMSVHGKLDSNWAIRAYAESLGLDGGQSPDVAPRAVAPSLSVQSETLRQAPALDLVHGEFGVPQVARNPADRATPAGSPSNPNAQSHKFPPGYVPAPPTQFVFAAGQSQVPRDHIPDAATLEANANRTLAALTSAPKVRAPVSEVDAAAERTLAALRNTPRNPHPEGTEAHKEFQQELDRMAHNSVDAAFEAAARRHQHKENN